MSKLGFSELDGTDLRHIRNREMWGNCLKRLNLGPKMIEDYYGKKYMFYLGGFGGLFLGLFGWMVIELYINFLFP